MKISRANFLQIIESVSAGLGTKDLVEQSGCFVFTKGQVVTFNEKVACFRTADLGIEGAVKARELRDLLSKLSEEEVEVTQTDSELQLIGRHRRAGIKMEKEIHLPIESVEAPSSWKSLPHGFLEAIQITKACASSDSSQFPCTCIHIHPKWVEACDTFQICRYPLEIELEKPILVEPSSISHISDLDVESFSLSESWVHFKNGAGVMTSCRLLQGEYPELSFLFDFKGSRVKFPPGITEALDKAEIFSSTRSGIKDNEVSVRMKSGKILVRGEGIYGWFEEVKKLDYDGVPMAFRIPPSILRDAINRNEEGEVSEERMRIIGKGYTYVTSLEIDGKGDPNAGSEPKEE